MARLTARKRRSLPASCFGLPAERKYPLSDPKHVALAKGRAAGQLRKGKLSRRDYLRVLARADKGPCK